MPVFAGLVVPHITKYYTFSLWFLKHQFSSKIVTLRYQHLENLGWVKGSVLVSTVWSQYWLVPRLPIEPNSENLFPFFSPAVNYDILQKSPRLIFLLKSGIFGGSSGEGTGGLGAPYPQFYDPDSLWWYIHVQTFMKLILLSFLFSISHECGSESLLKLTWWS